MFLFFFKLVHVLHLPELLHFRRVGAVLVFVFPFFSQDFFFPSFTKVCDSPLLSSFLSSHFLLLYELMLLFRKSFVRLESHRSCIHVEFDIFATGNCILYGRS
ncbi:hypothetical protein RchiOBHm_Chr7g0205231 [Rosa chinensis]|uniref:Uncharacterized protein n=1 Tax=Rosa chinensis TaxID=74649 RepID=A0A2P6P8W5_ROSCH|nr:hypothetical protein RchiOBHm_Chr7g0205231 [Rosa chinensis]